MCATNAYKKYKVEQVCSQTMMKYEDRTYSFGLVVCGTVKCFANRQSGVEQKASGTKATDMIFGNMPLVQQLPRKHVDFLTSF
jgi:hypothetical protein